jgi:2-polyprenyl-6-methoxyphenol hydroxylase-like FAD-dependent oxidoreductase
MTPKIAIIGAGPAGLTLASLLRASNKTLDVTVFEKAASAEEIFQKGGTLDLHNDTGLAAIRAAGLWDPFKKYARYEGQDLVLGDKHATRVFESHDNEDVDQDSPRARPEIDRGRLTEILLDSVPGDWIRWCSPLKSVSADGILSFEHGTEGPFDLIVGADGAWSKVRPVITDIRPEYAGISGFGLLIHNPAEDHPDVSKMVGRGSYFTYSDRKALAAQRQGSGDIMVYAWSTESEDYPEKLWKEVAHNGEQLKIALLETLFQDWAPELQSWIRACRSDTVRPWPIYELPVGTTWEHKKGFTLIGDAAHVISPFAGEGVNQAMKDALELVESIVESFEPGANLDTAVKKFEEAMFPRMEGIAEMTITMKTFQFREDAPWGFIEKMKEVMGGPEAEEQAPMKAQDVAAS